MAMNADKPCEKMLNLESLNLLLIKLIMTVSY